MRVDACMNFPSIGRHKRDWAEEAAGPVCHLASSTSNFHRAWNEEKQADRACLSPVQTRWKLEVDNTKLTVMTSYFCRLASLLLRMGELCAHRNARFHQRSAIGSEADGACLSQVDARARYKSTMLSSCTDQLLAARSLDFGQGRAGSVQERDSTGCRLRRDRQSVRINTNAFGLLKNHVGNVSPATNNSQPFLQRMMTQPRPR